MASIMSSELKVFISILQSFSSPLSTPLTNKKHISSPNLEFSALKVVVNVPGTYTENRF